MHIFIDFDYTLFDTNAMRQALIAALRQFGVTTENYQASEQQLRQTGIYDPDQHLKLIFAAPTKVQATATEKETSLFKQTRAAYYHVLDNAAEFLYADSIIFLQRYQLEKVTILSFGLESWQRHKIVNSGIAPYVDEIITTAKSKEEVISQWNAYDDIVLINDRGQEIDNIKNRRSDILAIRVRRPGTPYYNEPCTLCDFEAADLTFDLNQLFRDLYVV